jgi:cell division protein FtsW (lipid II flippase)
MKQPSLFPHWSRYLGYFCIVAHIPIMFMRHMDAFGHSPSFTPGDHHLFNTEHLFFIATFLLMVIGLILVAFSKEKIEDEQISRLRLDSLQWAIYLNYLILITSLIATDKMNSHFILALDTWVPLVFFIIRFRWVIFRLNQPLKTENPS